MIILGLSLWLGANLIAALWFLRPVRRKRSVRLRTSEIVNLRLTPYRIRAEDGLREMIEAQPEARGRQPYQQPTAFSNNPVERRITLAKAGIDQNLANRVRKIRALQREESERVIAGGRDAIERGVERHERARERLPVPALPLRRGLVKADFERAIVGFRGSDRMFCIVPSE